MLSESADARPGAWSLLVLHAGYAVRVSFRANSPARRLRLHAPSGDLVIAPSTMFVSFPSGAAACRRGSNTVANAEAEDMLVMQTAAMSPHAQAGIHCGERTLCGGPT